ncbi:MAG: hypothetical protein Q8N39_08725 [Pelolinea sp.]|nr:hypothetical protein [Pelolinea sp.]
MEINLLYFEGCPSWKNALTNLQIALKEEGMDISIKLIEVKSGHDVAGKKFLGSPTFQVYGEDFWPEDQPSYSMNCRIYATLEGLKGWPTIDMFRQKLLDMKKEKDKLK